MSACSCLRQERFTEHLGARSEGLCQTEQHPALHFVLLSSKVHFSFKYSHFPASALQVITPEEIVDPNVDEHSVMTYLSQFPKAKLKPGAPLRPKLNPKKARAYGPGKGTPENGSLVPCM